MSNFSRKYLLYDEVNFDEGRPRTVIILSVYIVLMIPVYKIMNCIGVYLSVKLFVMIFATPIMYSLTYYHKAAYMFLYVNSYDSLTIIIPALVFHFTYNLDLQMIWKAKYQLIINTIRILVEATLLCLLIFRLIQLERTEAIALGFIVTIPLPLSIITYLEDLGHYEYITVLLKVETIVMITVTDMALYYRLSTYGLADYAGWYILITFKYILLAIIVGFLYGNIIVWLILKNEGDQLNALILMLSSMYVAYGLIAVQCGISKCITTFVVGLTISSERIKYPQEMDKLIYVFWEQLFAFLDGFLLFSISCFFLWFMVDLKLYDEHYNIVIIYITSNILRFVTYCLFMPILKRLGYGMNLRSLVILTLAGIKDSVNLMLILRLFEHGPVDKLIFICLSLVFLSMLFNTSAMPFLLKKMGLSDISISRKTNMNNCMRFIMEKRARFISALKLNRYLSDADWSIINRATELMHPYKLSINEDPEGQFELRHNYCPYCKKEFPLELTKKENMLMMKEAYTRVLKAKRISFIRQFENGMLSKDGSMILLRAVELASFADSKQINEADILTKLSKRLRIFRFFVKLVLKSWSPREAFIVPPNVYYRKVCYYIVMHWLFDIIIYVIIVLISILTIMLLTLKNSEEVMIRYSISLYLFFALGNVIFTIECIMKIVGYSENRLLDGLKNYFRSWWNVVDFIILILSLADQTIDTIVLININLASTHVKTVRIIRIFRLVRIIRLLRLFRGAQPRLIKYLESNIDLNMALSFDIAKAMLVAFEEIEQQLGKLIEDEKIRIVIEADLLDNCTKVRKHLTLIAKERPWVSITVKTKQAIRTTLNEIRESIRELKFSGYIDTYEHMQLLQSLDESIKRAKRMKVIQRSLPKDIFKEISWMSGEPELTELLFKRVEKKSYETDDVICLQNQFCDGIIILITGILSLKYSPTEVDHLKELRDYGALPIFDFLSNVNFDVAVQDYAVSGSSIGELCYLTKRYYCSTVKADAPSEVFLIPNDVMDDAEAKYNDPIFGLEAHLWKYVTLDLVTKILMDTHFYSSTTQDNVKTQLERAFIPNIRNFNIIIVNNLIEDMVLLEGLAADNFTKEIYIAPCFISRNSHTLNLYKSSTISFETKVIPKILFIPVKDANAYEIMEKLEEDNDKLGYDMHSRIYNETAYSTKRRMRLKSTFKKTNRQYIDTKKETRG